MPRPVAKGVEVIVWIGLLALNIGRRPDTVLIVQLSIGLIAENLVCVVHSSELFSGILDIPLSGSLGQSIGISKIPLKSSEL